MAADYIACPKCGKKIELTDAFTGQIEERLRKEFDSKPRKPSMSMKLRSRC